MVSKYVAKAALQTDHQGPFKYELLEDSGKLRSKLDKLRQTW